MPVDFESHTPSDGRLDLSPGTNARTVMEFLLEHPGIGYTPRELAEATNIAKGSIGPTLQRLEKVGLVRHREPYWAAVRDDRLAAATAALVGIETTGERFGDDWYAQNEDWEDDLPDLSAEER